MRGKQISRAALEDQQRMVDGALVAAVVKTKLLLPVGGISGGIEIKNDFASVLDAGRAKFCETFQQAVVQRRPVAPGEVIFPAAQGGLGTQWLPRRGIDQQLEDRVVAQQAGIVGVLIAGDDLVEALPKPACGVCCVRSGGRESLNAAAQVRVKSCRSSNCRKGKSPASELIRPPSNCATIGRFRWKEKWSCA